MNSAGICEAHGRDNDGFALTDIYYTFADIYTSYNDLSKASYYLKKGFDVSLRKDIRKIGYSFANLAWISILNDSVPSIRRERELFRRAEVPDTSVLVRSAGRFSVPWTTSTTTTMRQHQGSLT